MVTEPSEELGLVQGSVCVQGLGWPFWLWVFPHAL